MKKQFILISAGALLVLVLFFFGKTSVPKKASVAVAEGSPSAKTFNVQSFIIAEKVHLSPENAVLVSKLENGISREDVVSQQVKAYEALAAFWKDSANLYEGYVFYTSAAAKLVNSEKNLTFAARLFSENLRHEGDEAKLRWETSEAIDLYKRAILLNPDNVDLHIELGSCFIYGRGKSGDPQETMEGILELLAVVRKDSTNMKAQMLLGVGGFVSGQLDKAVERLKKVVAAQPDNVEAISFLADTYAAKGEKAEATRWYTVSKRLMNNAAYSREVDERIKMLK